MTLSEALSSFAQSRNAGESKRGAWETVMNEIHMLLGELFECGLPTATTEATAEEWANLDYRTL